MIDIVKILQQDYQRFPINQTYSIYSVDVYFKDPLNEFRGIKRYQQMINFMATWLSDIKMDLYDIKRSGQQIDTRWTLFWTSPLPWRPRIAISGKTQLKLNDQDLIISHIDYWDCSRLDVVKQHFASK